MDGPSRIKTGSAARNAAARPAPTTSRVQKIDAGMLSLQRPLAAVIRRLREASGVSQEAFADHIQMHRTYYGAIERGARNMTLKSLEKVSKGLGEQLSKLIAEAERESPDLRIRGKLRHPAG